MDIEVRLERLERELARAKRRNRHILVFALVAAGVAVVAAAWIATPGKVLAENGAKAPTVVRASEFILEDADGKVRARLRVLTASLDADKDGPRLDLFDENGNGRVALGISKDGPALRLYDENGKGRVNLTTLKDGPGLSLIDENGKIRAGLIVTKYGPGLGLRDENGKSRAMLFAFKSGPGLTLDDENEKIRAALTVDKSGPGLNLYDAAVRPIWSAP